MQEKLEKYIHTISTKIEKNFVCDFLCEIHTAAALHHSRDSIMVKFSGRKPAHLFF